MNSNSSIYSELLHNKPLFIIFGGLKGTLNEAPFEMYNILKDYPISKLMIRDLFQCWFFKGLTGRGEHEVTEYIQKIIKEYNPEKIIFFGTSAGGFACLKYSQYINPDYVYCFSPQTTIDREFLDSINDTRWKSQRNKAYKYYQAGFALSLDSLSYINKRLENKIEIHVCNGFKRDIQHAERTPYKIIRHKCKQHPVIKYLKTNGELKILLESLI